MTLKSAMHWISLWVAVYEEAITSVRRLRKWNNPPALEWYTFMNNSLQQIELVGPSTGWFAFGIGNSTMDNTYAIVISEDGELSEHILGDHNAGFVCILSLSLYLFPSFHCIHAVILSVSNGIPNSDFRP